MRNHFTIHGGWSSGSAGCIDLEDEEGFFAKLIEVRGDDTKIDLIVDYSLK